MTELSFGLPLPRVDGPAKVTGQARYAAEFDQPGQAHGVIVSSTVGLGRIVGIDDRETLALPGVLAVLSHLNAPKLAYRKHKSGIDPAFGERLHVLQDDRIRFFGQPVAVVVAETLDQAEHAANRLGLSYESEPPVVGLDHAEAVEIIPDAGRQPGGRASDSARGDADAALGRAEVQVDATYGMARENHNPMEPHATVAAWQGDQLTLWSKSQYVVNEAAQIEAVFGLAKRSVRVICPYVGGGFGTSLRTWPHVTLAALAARHVGRPVKLVLTRRQMFDTTGHRPCTRQRVALGASADGVLSALIHEGTGETSRHEQFVEALTAASRYLYSCPNVRTRYRLTPLDTGTPTYMRGPGEASGIFAVESAMDELAVKLGMDPVALRLRNEPDHDEAHDLPFSSRSLRACYEAGATRFGWSRRDPRPGSMRDGRLLIGWGMASATYPTMRAGAKARARLLADGSVEVETAASDMGPGTYTSMSQVAADALGLAVDDIRFALGRSDFPAAPPHGGSMTMASVGSAVQAACLALREASGLGNAVPSRQAYGALVARRGEPIVADAASAGGAEQQRFSMHAFGAVFAEVAVDPDLAMVRVRRVVGAYGAGRIVNPLLARSQCTGGMVGGIGMALMEQTVLDPRDGRPVNASMADYLVPVSLDIGTLEALFVEETDPHLNPLGVKGLGEIALVGTAPAVTNAVFHATGRRVRDLPIRIEALL
ncbi:xanthine dehydrogenase family protein molybdopterin-binding subunit [Phreatobacter stygius]|uniref:Xanthine dehydrogenase family protein molybdopterin-binding subunit n=1 Tax=Phreatobacter stygius TaxID=1940610 RepID=A0A4D7AVX8_9HYPH|nr:xanthine dehydrogenase family protein molybdopterin-binding subunit [Phreatobacter stygius]QCI64001.1 xanthine dehydrogenase family protein molybdopterin-binding subunit [Phreatobacter stygius]